MIQRVERGFCESRHRRGLRGLLLTTLLVSASSQAVAQVPPRVLPPTREEVTRPESRPPIDQRPRLEIEGGIERAPCALDNPELIKHIQRVGVVFYSRD